MKNTLHSTLFLSIFLYETTDLLAVNSTIWGAKVLISFELRKKYAKFSATFYVFFQKSSTFAQEIARNQAAFRKN